MLRITTHDCADGLTIQLEGRLTGPWVRELDTTWHQALKDRNGRSLRVDLTAVTFVGSDGKELLALMHRQGAELTAAGCLMKAIVADLTSRSASQEIPDPDHL